MFTEIGNNPENTAVSSAGSNKSHPKSDTLCNMLSVISSTAESLFHWNVDGMVGWARFNVPLDTV